MTDGIESKIRRVLDEVGRLPVDANTLEVDADLYLAGMSSHASVDVMLELEDAFGIEFPSQMLTRSAFESIASIAAVVDELRRRAA